MRLCAYYGEGTGSDRSSRSQIQAQQARALADELGILNSVDFDWQSLQESDAELQYGTEHFVEFDVVSHRVGKTTVPPKFGLIPTVISKPQVNLRADPTLPAFKEQIEFIPATPLEYLERWIAANEVFEDDVRLTSVVEWSDGCVSFSISQPQYHGAPATQREIEDYFVAAGWKRIFGQHRPPAVLQLRFRGAGHRCTAEKLLHQRWQPASV